MIYTVYILYSANFNKTYVGFTSNLIARFQSHNIYVQKGYTIRYRPWVVIYTCPFDTRKAATQHEQWLKSGTGRDWIKTKMKAEFATNHFIFPHTQST